MNKQLKFWLVSLWIIFSRAYDAYATYVFTPDLSKEMNPLASILGLGWNPILLIVMGLTLYVVYAYYCSEFKPYNITPTEKGFSFSQFCTFLYLGRKRHWTAVLYQLPTDFNRIRQYTGVVLSPSLAYAGVISTLMWIGINYTTFYKQYHNAYAIYGLLILGVFGISIYKSWELYQVYDKD
ncbi:MAG: hypothetical protein ACKVTZ_23135 [Bacteroidia bacterium]